MTTLRQAIEKDRALRKIRRPDKMLVPVAGGLRFAETSTGSQVFHCGQCQAMVVDSPRGRENHAQRMPACRTAMGVN